MLSLPRFARKEKGSGRASASSTACADPGLHPLPRREPDGSGARVRDSPCSRGAQPLPDSEISRREALRHRIRRLPHGPRARSTRPQCRLRKFDLGLYTLHSSEFTVLLRRYWREEAPASGEDFSSPEKWFLSNRLPEFQPSRKFLIGENFHPGKP